MDGKYIAVKGYDKKIPFIYGIDYLTHDIPFGSLFLAEDSISFYEFFRVLRDELNYPLRVVVADDRKGIFTALNQVFPYAVLQFCHVHYLENLRQSLNIRTQGEYHPFFNALLKHVFRGARNQQEVMTGLSHVFSNYTKESLILRNIVLDIRDRGEELFNYLDIKNCPNNTNLIELYNSHLSGRLKTIKGFESFSTAKKWLNAYLIRRRTKPLTDCETKFKHLNGQASLAHTIKDLKKYPTWIPGVNMPKKTLKR